MVFVVPAAAVLLLLAYGVWTFNRMVGLARRADGAWSDIDVQLKRRWDLVPALAETAKGYARHEAGVLERVAAARQASSVAARAERESELSGAVRGLFALVEAYPELKASRSYLELHDSLVGIEDQVQHARRYYNAVVRDLNTLVAGFPSGVVARACGFREREFFGLDDAAERAAPRIVP